MHLLDTDTLTHLNLGHAQVTAHVAAMNPAEVGTTIVTKAELLRGRLEYLLKASDLTQIMRAQELLQRTEIALDRMHIVLFDVSSLAIFDGLCRTKGLKKIGRADLLIASIALAHRATLVTSNMRDFRRIPNLQVANWMD